MGSVLEELRNNINSGDMPSYIYGYPSKRTYSTLEEGVDLKGIWKNTQGMVNIYIHIPFCNYKCSYCTLLMVNNGDDNLIDTYVSTLINQIEMYGKIAGHLEVASIYFGGGTPTIMTDGQFDLIFDAIHKNFMKIGQDIEISVEGSPETITVDKLKHLKGLGVNRISVGIQTLDPEELKKTGRGHSHLTSIRAINNIKEVGFTNFNLDLIYGLESQTTDNWADILETVLSFNPKTISLYPIVIRDLTAIEKRKNNNDESFLDNGEKYNIYDFNVEFLEKYGYRQESLTRFTKFNGDSYAQEINDFDGMPLIGIGAGARSYSKDFHYSLDYAVLNSNKQEIINNFINGGWNQLESTLHGMFLTSEEEKRRYIILNLLVNKLNVEKANKK
ncbi:MAG: radical SAM protein, partial [Clostridium sp.]